MVRALCSHRRGRGFEPLYLYQRFERRLEAIQKNGSLAQVPLPFFLPRPLPCSPLRADIGKRNCDARQASLFRHYAIASFLTSPSISTSASSVGLKRSKKTGVWHKCHSLCFASNSLIKYHTPLFPAKRFTFARVCRIIFTVTGEIYAKD